MKRYVAAVLLILYVAVWSQQKGKAAWDDYYLSSAPPATVLKVACGYARQLAGFALFVKVAIFAGGPLRGVDKMSYADNLASNFDVMSKLYPEFIDIYHYSQSFLAPISPKYAGAANAVHNRGIATHPDVLYLKFFKGFNYYYFMHEPLKAADVFFSMTKYPDCPPWIGRLAGGLLGRGGNLLAGRTMLQAMYETEQDKIAKQRYLRSIQNFDKALRVQAALDAYRKEQGKDAASLQDLMPRYLNSLPHLNEGFTLVWEPPLLRLDRP